MPKRVPTARRRTRASDAQARDQARGSAASRGYDAHHRRWREAVLARDPWCVFCARAERYIAATVADHITPIVVDPSRRLDLDNGRGLCATCHNRVTARFRTTGVNEL